MRNYLAAQSAARGKSIFSSPKRYRSFIEPLEARHLLSATVIEVTTTEDIVDPNDAFISLREAVLMANASPEDHEIRLPTGTYTLTRQGANEDAGLTGDLDIKANGTLRILGINQPTIDASGLFNPTLGYGDRAIDVHAGAKVVLERLTLANGQAPNAGSSSDKNGGSIRSTGADLVVLNLRVRDSYAPNSGGGIAAVGGTLEVRLSEFLDNEAVSDGGGIFSNSELTAIRTTFLRNDAHRGGGLYSAANAEVKEDSTFRDNTAVSGGAVAATGELTLDRGNLWLNSATTGGAILGIGGVISVTDSTISANSANFGGAIASDADSLVIRGSNLSGNLASADGGAILARGGLETSDSLLLGNSADRGGAIYWASGTVPIGGELLFSGCTLLGNQARRGGGIFIAGSDQLTTTISNTQIVDNAARQLGGGIYVGTGGNAIINVVDSRIVKNSALQGGGIYNVGTLLLSRTGFEENTAGVGGALVNFRAGLFGNVHVFESVFTRNVGDRGAAISSLYGSLVVSNTTFDQNVSSEWSGAIHIEGPQLPFGELSEYDALIEGSTFTGNSATHGGAIGNAGGSIKLLGSTLTGNQVSRQGGGIHTAVDSHTLIVNSTISANVAAESGGGVHNAGFTSLRNTTVVLNQAPSGGGVQGTRDLQNTIVAGNRVSAASNAAPSDLFHTNTPSSGGFNLIADPNTAGGFANGVNGNIVGDGLGGVFDINKVLDTTLADNGGPTLTHALLYTSPALNAGDPAFDPNQFDPPLEFDQRGAPHARVVGGRIDIGAFEASDPLPVDGVITVTTFDDIVAVDGLWSLREAVLWANAHPEDYEIVLSAGIYNLTRQGANEDAGLTGDLDIKANGSLRIVGAGRYNTTIDASGLYNSELGYGDRIFDVLAGANVEIEAVALTGGRTGPGLSYISANGGAIHIRLAALSLIDSSFTGNLSAADGGAIASKDSYVRVDGTRFSENAANLGGAIHHDYGFYPDVSGSPTLLIQDSVFTANQAGDGGAIWNSGKMQIAQSTLSGNEAIGSGGAIRSEGFASVTDSNITDNTAKSGGGIFSSFERNLPDRYAFEIVRTTVSGNTATTTSLQQGGGAIVNSGRMLIEESTISENVSGGLGGGILNFPSQNIGILQIIGSTLSDNTAHHGGAIYNHVIANVSIFGSSFSGNSAVYGGALAGGGSFARFEVGASTFAQNSATEDGGAIYGSVSVSNSSFAENTAKNGGAIGGFVGPILASTFTQNSATMAGGAIHATSSGPLMIVNSTVSGNTAQTGGGIAVPIGSQLELLNSTVVLNHAEAGGGLAVLDLAAATLSNSIVAGNVAGPSGSETASDIALLGGSLNPTSSYNLVGDPNSAGGLTSGLNGNIVGDGLGGVLDVATVIDTTLADNGGPTPTHALLPGGAAVNAGDSAFDPNNTDPPTLFDGRGAGFARITGGRVDIGAFEFGSEFENLVASRYIFYNNSWYDGQSSAINEVDRFAIDPTKQALLPDGTLADSANITSYSRGINGIMIDLAGSHPDITADDFIFRVGATNDRASWAAAPAPSAIQVYAGQGVGGADRIVITWPDGAILNTYLQVIVAANEDTGLAEPDVFFFGNRVGDSFSTQPPAAFLTSAADELAARNATPKFNLDVSNPYDFDKSRTVTAADMLIARNNSGFLPRIQIAPPAAASPLTVHAAATVSHVSDTPLGRTPATDGNAIASALTRVTATPEIAMARNELPPTPNDITLEHRFVDCAVSMLWAQPSDSLASSSDGDAPGDALAHLEDVILELIHLG